LLEVLQGLAAVVSFIKGAFDIREALIKIKGRNPTKQELQGAIEESEMLKGLVESSKKEKIIESVANERS